MRLEKIRLEEERKRAVVQKSEVSERFEENSRIEELRRQDELKRLEKQRLEQMIIQGKILILTLIFLNNEISFYRVQSNCWSSCKEI